MDKDSRFQMYEEDSKCVKRWNIAESPTTVPNQNVYPNSTNHGLSHNHSDNNMRIRRLSSVTLFRALTCCSTEPSYQHHHCSSVFDAVTPNISMVNDKSYQAVPKCATGVRTGGRFISANKILMSINLEAAEVIHLFPVHLTVTLSLVYL